MNERITGSMVAVSALLPSNASTASGNPVSSVSRPMVICGSRRRSLENPGSRNPSPASVSKYNVDTSYSTRLAGPSPACRAHATESACRHSGLAYLGRRRFNVGYDRPGMPASSSTRVESSLEVGSMIRASVSCQNTSSSPVAASKPSAVNPVVSESTRWPIREAVIGNGPPASAVAVTSNPRSSTP
jgi:hypothetical protein